MKNEFNAKKSIILFILFIFFITFSNKATASKVEKGIITGDSVRIRSKASLSSSIVTKLFKGNEVKVISSVSGDAYKGIKKWYKVKLNNIYSEGFVHSKFLLTGKKAVSYRKKLGNKVHMKKLKKLFTNSQIKKMFYFSKKFRNIKTLKDFSDTFKFANKLRENLTKVVRKLYSKMQGSKGYSNQQLNISWIYYYLPTFTISYVAEGTEAIFSIMYNDFLRKAKKTNNKVDDMFIKLLIFSYGNEHDFFGSWFDQTWDYGGFSLLGKGIHFKILRKIDKINEKTLLFKKELISLKDELIRDICGWKSYSGKKEKLIAEVEKILKTIKVITINDKKKLKKRLKQFKNPTKDLEMNCKIATCNQG